MGDFVVTEQCLVAKFEVLLPHLDERQRRLVLAAEARMLGRGGGRLVARGAGGRAAGFGGPGVVASGWRMSMRACGLRCCRWSSRTSGVIRPRRCGGRPNRPA